MTIDEAKDMIKEVFALPADFSFTDGLRPAAVPGWDSMGWLQLLTAIEERCGREVPMELFDRIITVQDACDAVCRFSMKKPVGCDELATGNYLHVDL